ncbi:dendritic arbor reduction protein 1 [Caerostris extrusa]|uniref:Dendritic arbor reduction protein 1 n=1 Tax=Caerostris extrusa TaxID=172846 RepID=A0AAV4S893_CAEEX|nr:dendritic arbor reduction protein 1 [Caerostris extrusa]
MRMGYNNANGNSIGEVHPVNYPGVNGYHQNGHVNNTLYHQPHQNNKTDYSTDVFAKPASFGEHCSNVRNKIENGRPVMSSSQDAVSVKTELVRNHCPFTISNGNNGAYNTPDQEQMFMEVFLNNSQKDDCYRSRIPSTAGTAYPNSPSIPSSGPGLQHSHPPPHQQFIDTSRQPCFRVGGSATTTNSVPNANGTYEPLTPPPSEPNTSPPLDSLSRKTPPPPYPAPFSASKNAGDLPSQPKYNRRNNPDLEKKTNTFLQFSRLQ